MRTRILFAILAIMSLGTLQAQSLYESLREVNERWAHEKNLPEEIFELPAEENPIQTHLFWVHRILSERPTSHLTKIQRQNRAHSLQNLAEYAQAGVFPKNLYHPQRQPVFIDPFDTYCAVGHLIKTSGHDDLARSISKEMNYAYLLDMNMKRLDSWVLQSGFTPEELAWIQPGYPSIQNFQAMKEGVNGPVNKIHILGSWELLAAGSFDTAGTSAAGSMASYISGVAGFAWIPFGSGSISHEVYDIEIWNGSTVVAGDIWQAGSAGVASGVAIWNGSQWQGMGNFYIGALPNIVYDIAIYNNELYAAGMFRSPVNAPTYFQNFAKWDGTEWVAVGSPDGPVSALAVHNGKLILGGSFSQIDGTTYNHIAAYNGSAFEALDNGVPTNVKAIETYDGKLFAGCQLLSAGQQDTFALGYYDGSQWTRVIGDPWHFQAQTNLHQISINALKATPYGLFAGGNFFYPNFGTYGRNLLRYDNGTIQGFGILDSTVNSLAYLGGELFVGGDFTHAFGPGGMMPLNHITYINVAAVFSTDEQVNLQTNLFPNPARNYAELSFENPVDVKDIQLTGITGQTIRMPYTEEGNGRYRLDVSGLASGAHILSVYTDAGILERKLVIAR